MRRNIKNDKVIKAITIGLATMIAATSAPLDVLADTKTPAAEPAPAPAPAAETAPAPEPAAEPAPEPAAEPQASTPVAELQTPAPPTGPLASVAETPVDTQVAMNVANELVNVDSNTQAETGLIPDAIAAVTPEGAGTEDNLFDGVKKDLEDAKDLINGYVEDYQEKGVKNDLENIGSKESFEVTTEPSTVLKTDDPDNHPTEGDYPRNEDGSPVYDNNKLITVETNDPLLQNFYDSYTNAVSNLQNGDVDKATAFAAEASAKLDESRESITGLKNAIKDTKAAEAAVVAAQQKADAIETIRDQYYAVLVQYYRSLPTSVTVRDKKGNTVYEKDENGEFIYQTDKNGKPQKIEKKTDVLDENGNQINSGSVAVFNSDGTLDLEASAKNLQNLYVVDSDGDKVSLANYMADNPNGNVVKLSRYLMEQLITASIKDSDVKLAKTENNIRVGVDIKGSNGKSLGSAQTGNKGIVTNKNKKDQVSLGEARTYYKINQSAAKAKANDAGRTNRYCVEYDYIDENGDTKTETKYYNYIFKSNIHADKDYVDNFAEEMKNGILYLAEIVPDGNGDWKTVDTNTKYDDFSEIDAKAKTAKKAVEAAKNKVTELWTAISNMGMAATDTDSIEKMEGKLSVAEKALENSEKVFGVLSGLLDGYVVPVIPVNPGPSNDNPSEDNITDDDDTTDDDDATTGGDETPGTGGGVVFDPSTGTFSAPAYGFGSTILPGFTGGPATGVLGVRTGGGTEADEGGVADSRTNVAPRADFGTVNKVLGSRQNKDNSQIVKKIKDNEIPLAEIPNMDDEVTMNWMWLLIIFLLGATGKKMYDEYKKKKEAEEAAKINK